MVALVAPHIDPWRGARRATATPTAALARGVPGEADTFVALRHVARPDARALRALPQGLRHPARRGRGRRRRASTPSPRGADGFDPVRRPVQPQARALARVPGRLPEAPAQGAPLPHRPRPRRPRRPAGQRRATPRRDARVAALHRTACARSSRRARAASSSSPAPTWRTWGPASATRDPYDAEQRARARAAPTAASLERAIALDAPGFWAHVARRPRRAPRLRPGADLVAPADARTGGARGASAPLRADGRRRGRLDREPRGGGVLWVGRCKAPEGPGKERAARGGRRSAAEAKVPLAVSLTCRIARATSGGRSVRGSNSVVECHLAKVDVEGSNPFSRSKIEEPEMALVPFLVPSG